MINALVNGLFQIKGDFQKLFFHKEHDELAGEKSKKIITLIAILTFTLLALGFAIGGTKYLETKMSDPFTNWVDLPVKGSYKKYVGDLFKEFSDKEKSDYFLLDNIKEYNREYKRFVTASSDTLRLMMRTYQPDGKIFKEILSDIKGNVVSGLSYQGDDESFFDAYNKCGLILSQSKMKEMGYKDLSELKYIALVDLDDIFYFPIISIVKEIPNDADVLISSHLYNLIFSDFEDSGFINVFSSKQFDILSKNNADREGIESFVKNQFSNRGNIYFDHNDLELRKDEISTVTTIYFENEYEIDILDSLFKSLRIANPQLERYMNYQCELGERYSIADPYYLSFNFNRLDSVRAFKNHLKDKYEIEVSMAQIESKENFALVSKLTALLSTILFGFSLLSIVFYINSLLSSHLEKIKMNLGTFKAFGLSNKLLISTYMKIISYYILKAVVISFVVCLIFEIGESFLFKNNYFDVFNWRILVAILIIIIITLYTSRKTISKFLLKTPGDLIYNR